MFPANEGLGATTLMFVLVETCLVPPAKIISIMPICVTIDCRVAHGREAVLSLSGARLQKNQYYN